MSSVVTGSVPFSWTAGRRRRAVPGSARPGGTRPPMGARNRRRASPSRAGWPRQEAHRHCHGQREYLESGSFSDSSGFQEQDERRSRAGEKERSYDGKA
jgi:hypothetical protein